MQFRHGNNSTGFVTGACYGPQLGWLKEFAKEVTGFMDYIFRPLLKFWEYAELRSV